MEEHRSRPGVQHGEHTEAGSHVTGVAGQFLQRSGGGLHQQTVEFFGMSASNRMQFSGECEGQQVVITGRQSGPLAGNPAIRLILVTLRATAVAAGVIGVHLSAAVAALMDMASKERRSTVRDIGQGPLVDSSQAMRRFFAKRFTVEADDVGHLQHETSGSEVLHELIERIGQSRPNLRGQMRIDLRGARAAVSEILLNDPQIDSCLQQMGGIGMPQRMDVSIFADTCRLAGAMKRHSQIRSMDGPVASEPRRKQPRGISMRPPVNAQ